jgi:hypothetical protein
MTDTAIDAAIAEALGDSAVASNGDYPDITAPGEGACSREEARALIAKAIGAAETFQSVMMELFSRKAHVALGYSTPREMLLCEFKDTILNPATGKPYSDSHIHRMARVAWLAWAIAERTGVDMADLRIPERPLREIASGFGGRNDRDLVDEIEQRVALVAQDKDAAPDLVDSVINDVLNEASGRSPRLPRDPDSIPPEAPDGDFDSIQGEGEFGGRASKPKRRTADDDVEDADGIDSRPSDRTSGESPSALSAFGDTSNTDSHQAPPLPTPPGGLDMGAALKALRESGDFTRTLQEIISIGERLPQVAAVEAKLPEFLDALDDSELAGFKSLLSRTTEFLDAAESAKRAIDAVLAETDVRIDETL